MRLPRSPQNACPPPPALPRPARGVGYDPFNMAIPLQEAFQVPILPAVLYRCPPAVHCRLRSRKGHAEGGWLGISPFGTRLETFDTGRPFVRTHTRRTHAVAPRRTFAVHKRYAAPHCTYAMPPQGLLEQFLPHLLAEVEGAASFLLLYQGDMESKGGGRPRCTCSTNAVRS